MSAGYGISSKIVAGFGIQISSGYGIGHKMIAGYGILIPRGNEIRSELCLVYPKCDFFGNLSKPKEEINSQEKDFVSFRVTYKFAYPPGYRFL